MNPIKGFMAHYCARTKVRRIGHVCQHVRATPHPHRLLHKTCLWGAEDLDSSVGTKKYHLFKQSGNSSAGQATENVLPRTPSPPLTQDMQVRQNFLPPDVYLKRIVVV